MTRKCGALGHINPAPEAEEAVWSCTLQREELLGREAAGNRPTGTPATLGEKRRLSGE